MKWTSLAAFVALVLPSANALIRFPCAQLVTERTDPLVDPGRVSAHVHQIIGGNAFNMTMPQGYDLAKMATCTSCKFTENKSNYWTAVMYFRHTNGSYIRVPQKPNHVTGNPNGGMTVYYMNAPRGKKTTAFPVGFRMITGNPMRRSRPNWDETQPEAFSLTFRCWEDTSFTGPSNSFPPGVGRYDTMELPNKKCPGGIRANIFFPNCWNGKDLDPPDHASHMAFFQGRVNTQAGIILMDGNCPSTHPVRMPLILFETAWDTNQFSNMWPSDGKQPFVLSMGDPTGYGHHGDYVFGWEGDALQRAMDNCFDTFGAPESCPTLKTQTDQQMNSCQKSSVVNERVEGTYLSALPGCNPIQNGPGTATMANCGGSTPTVTQTQTQTTTTAVTSTTTQVNPTPVGPLVPKYGQCGGNGWTGATQCVAGSTCTKLNDWYSQSYPAVLTPVEHHQTSRRAFSSTPISRVASASSDPTKPTCTTILNKPGQPDVYSFFEKATSTWQYVIVDPSTKKAAIVDPVLDYDPASGVIKTTTADGLLGFVQSNGFDVVMLMETHAHADHITAAQYLKKKLGGEVPVGIGKRIVGVQERFAKVYGVPREWWDGAFDKYWEDNERFRIGELEGTIIHLPGHTPDHVGYMCGEGLFVGDTLFYPDVGSARADFPGGSPTELYDSIQRVLALSPSTRVYAGHDYPPEDSSPVEKRCWSLVSEQREKNVHLKARLDEIRSSSSLHSQGGADEDLAKKLMDAFIEWRAKRDKSLGAPRLLHPSLQANICAGKLPRPDAEGRRVFKTPLKVPEGL